MKKEVYDWIEQDFEKKRTIKKIKKKRWTVEE
jgi:hypothetical protein